MKVIVIPYAPNKHMGNIFWKQSFPMKAGKFPTNHPVSGGFCDKENGQCGSGDNIDSFRKKGYWASCFPEGDGITWEPKNNQAEAQCISDIKECFGWDIVSEI